MANLQNFDIFFGQDKVLELTVTDEADAVIDVSSATFTWVMSGYPGDTADITKTVGSGITITDGPNGRIDIALAETDTVNLSANGIYYHELWMTSGTNEFPVLYGKVNGKKKGS